MSKAIPVKEVPGQSIDGVNFQAIPSGSGTIVTTSATQTLTAKTLTSPTVTGGTFAGGTFTEPVVLMDVQALTAVGTNQATAGAITATSPGFVYSTGGNNAVGIVLPSSSNGAHYYVKNAAADILFVYPGVNCTINAIAANTKIDMATVTSAMFVKINTTSWQTLPTVPS